MKFIEFVERHKNYPIIHSQDFGILDGNPALLRLQVYKWVKKGWLVELKKGIYIINEPFRKSPPLFFVANHLLFPSYISMGTALSYYGLIPETTFSVVTSISTKKTSRYRNTLGVFLYHHIKHKLFMGFNKMEFDEYTVNIAVPEKALLDYFYLKYLTYKDLDSLRLQNLEIFNKDKLLSLSREYPLRISKMVKLLL